jgi:hypothetical protein
MTISPPAIASAPPPASTPSSIATPKIPIPTPNSAPALSLCSPLSTNASRKVKIGAVATRIPVSEDEMCSSPRPISVSGPATCTRASTTIGPKRPRRLRSTPRCIASGTRTSAASAVRIETIDQAENTSSSATLMKRYDAPQNALRRSRRAMDRRDTFPRLADDPQCAQSQLLGARISAPYAPDDRRCCLPTRGWKDRRAPVFWDLDAALEAVGCRESGDAEPMPGP